MGIAIELAVAERDTTARRLKRQRDRLKAAILGVGGVELTGHPTDRLSGILSVVVKDVDGAALVIKLDLDGVAASVGSACTTGSSDPSHVLTAMGYPDDEARGSLRISIGRTTTDAEIDAAAGILRRVLGEARAGAATLAADPLGQGVVAGGLSSSLTP
jgi:cysteine desulfurase